MTRELAEWVAGLEFEDLPQPAVEEAGRVLADYLGESLFVGATKPWGQSIAAFCAAQGGGQPEATIIATGKKTLASRAALANGTMALGFEYADFNGLGTALSVCGDRSPRPGRGSSTLGQGTRPLDRHRVRGDRSDYQGDPSAPVGPRSTCLRSTAPSAPPPVPPGCSASPRCSPTMPSGWRRRSPVERSRATRRAPGRRSLNGGMASERGVTAAELAETGFRATELGLEGIQAFAKMYSDGRLGRRGVTRWPGRVL